MGSGTERTITETVREVYELCCTPGARIKYRTLRLEKLERTDGARARWRVTRNGEYIDTINVDAFKSAGQLQRWLDAVAEAAVDGEQCPSCVGSVPSD